MSTSSKRVLLVVGVIALVAMLVPGVAFANNGVHGNYAMNTDQCAGCHRAHTAPSAVTWQRSDINPLTDPDLQKRTDLKPGERSALLVGHSTDIDEFCYTCHGASALGADTNVEEGVYEDRGPSAGAYGTDDAALISGAFGRHDVDPQTGDVSEAAFDWNDKLVTSQHYEAGQAWPAWGGGRVGATADTSPTWTASIIGTGLAGSGETPVAVGCSSCHDVHGTSNYRLLKNSVYGVAVGGYGGNGVPIPYVSSVETGFPLGGFAKGTAYPDYKPDYTTPKYARPSDSDPLKGMSGWCVGCHTYYMGELNVSDSQLYNTGSGVMTQHRHPVNVPLTNFDGGGTDVSAESSDTTKQLPLAHAVGENMAAGGIENTEDDWLDCMTCHTAHGTTAVMTGWAAIQDPSRPTETNVGGAGPSGDSALLRFDNRYVCQACHEK